MASQHRNTRTEIPQHLLVNDILARLPTKTLIKFKSVSKEWKSIISSVDFSKIHFMHLCNHPISAVLTYDNGVLPFELIDVNGNHNLEIQRSRHGMNIRSQCLLKSSCNGLVFMITCNQTVIPLLLHLYNFCYVVYNPVLGSDHFIIIPHSNLEYPLSDNTHGNYHFGFGYVSSTDDYRIVAIHSRCNTKVTAHEYSLRSRRWMTCTNPNITKDLSPVTLKMHFQTLWLQNEGATLVSETLYWVILVRNRQLGVVAYDLATQGRKLRFMFLPQLVFGYDSTGLCCLNGCLCVWARKTEDDVVELWMMKRYTEREPWTLLFRFGPNNFISHTFIGSILNPDEVLVLADHDMLFLAIYHRRQMYRYPLAIARGKLDAVTYVPSLVSVLAFNSVPRLRQPPRGHMVVRTH